MTTIIGANSTGAGVRYTLADNERIFVLGGANVVSTDSTAIQGLGSYNAVTVAGWVAGDIDGIALSSSLSGSSSSVTVQSGAVVSGADDAIQIYSSDALVANYGTLSGAYGINQSSNGLGASTFFNAGVISASFTAFYLGGDGSRVITNTGTIFGLDYAVRSFANSIETLINRGSIVGTVALGGNNDLYDGRGGTVQGTIYGEDGNDRFLPGSGIESIDGGLGVDLLDFRSSSTGLTVALDAAIGNTGVAAGDSYSGIESVYGAAFAADFLRGNGLNNGLYGFGGNDTLIGVAGNDLLRGDAGKDLLNGGAGNDTFAFIALSEAGDVIQDFSAVGGNNDSFRITAAGFGGGLMAGVLAAGQFQTRADNLAQDANDRFIFRTTDATLWFDANGNAVGGLTLVADLQAGAVVTAGDIVLV